MLRKIKTRIKDLLFPDIRYRRYKIPARLAKLGTDYGGWIIPPELLNEHSICYLAGAGEDISFDTALANRVRCDVFIFDPTPRAKAHFDRTVASAESGKPLIIYGNYQYEIDRETVRHLRFRELGIWKQGGIVKFFAPKDESHVSHSISNLQDTSGYFEAKVERLSEIMRSNNHSRIHLLKLDIEGAEYDVIDSIIEDKLPIGILCVEFHPGPAGELDIVQAAVEKLEDNGYAVIARENLDFTFINTKDKGN